MLDVRRLTVAALAASTLTLGACGGSDEPAAPSGESVATPVIEKLEGSSRFFNAFAIVDAYSKAIDGKPKSTCTDAGTLIVAFAERLNKDGRLSSGELAEVQTDVPDFASSCED